MNFFLYLFLLTFVCFDVFAETQSPKNVSLNGISFFEYTVKKKETLYELSKKFDVSQETILRYNSTAIDGLKEGMTLRIPNTEIKRNKKNISLNSNENSIKHIVKKGETIYSISHEYDITQEELLKLNPHLVNGLKTGVEITINKGKANEKKEFLKHVVQKKETLYGISKDLNISISEIEKYNPDIKNGLKFGDTLLIPLFKEEKKAVITEEKTIPSSLPKEKKENTIIEQHPRKSVRVVLLLPLMLDNTSNQDATINKFLDFYAGILMGVKELKSHGYNIELNTYDTEKSEEKVRHILNDPTIVKSDLIIGPAYGLQIKPIAEFAKRNEIPVVIPFSKKVPEIDNNPFLFQFNANTRYSFQRMANLFENQFSNKNIIFIQFSQHTTDDFSGFLQHYLTTKKIHFQKVKASELSSSKSLLQQKNNLLVLCTKDPDEAETSIVEIQSWNIPSYSVSLFASEELEESLNLANDIYYFSSFYITSGSNYLRYQNYFQTNFTNALTENPRFDLLGHDLSVYFIKNISHNGKSFTIPKDETEQQLQSCLAFRRMNPNGGYINEGCFLLRSKNGLKTKIK